MIPETKRGYNIWISAKPHMDHIAYANFYSIQNIYHFNVREIKQFLSDASLKKFEHLDKKLVIDHYDLSSERQEKMKPIGNG